MDDFDEFVGARYARLCRTAYVLCGDHAHAEDLVQTALAKTYEAWRRQRVDDLDAYARRVLLNTFLGWRRRRWHGEVPSAVLPERAAGGDAAADADLRRVVLAAVGLLPAGQRAVVALRYLEDLSEEETARVLGCSRGTVKSRASRALAALRENGVLLDRPAPEPTSATAETGALG